MVGVDSDVRGIYLNRLNNPFIFQNLFYEALKNYILNAGQPKHVCVCVRMYVILHLSF